MVDQHNPSDLHWLGSRVMLSGILELPQLIWRLVVDGVANGASDVDENVFGGLI